MRRSYNLPALASLLLVAMNGRTRADFVVRTDAVVGGQLKAASVSVANGLSVLGDVDVAQGSIFASTLEVADKARVGSVETSVIRSPTGTLVIDGNLAMMNTDVVDDMPKPILLEEASSVRTAEGVVAASVPSMASAQVRTTAFHADELVLGGVKQWRLVRHDHFDDGKTASWRQVSSHSAGAVARGGAHTEVSSGAASPKLSSCHQSLDRFLGGHCNAGSGELVKTFENLPPHTQLRVTASYHQIDKWEGETAYAKVDDAYVWTHASTGAPGSAEAPRFRGIDLCGSPDHADEKIGHVVDISRPHTAEQVRVAFGSNGKDDSCRRSFGVDDVAIYVK